MVLADPRRSETGVRLSDSAWTAADGASLYGLDRWGDPYFSVNARGHMLVQPRGDRGGSLDLVELVRELQGRGLSLPLLIRFDDILEDRLERLHGAFERAIAQYGYAGRYQGVFPVKCNQQRHVVEQLVESGRRWHFGLEAGSKAELLIALSLLDDPDALLICNGYKDRRFIETAILARQLGRQPVVVIEQADEVPRIIAASHELGAAPLIGIRAKLATRSTGRWGSSVGERAKFGLSVPQLLSCVEALRQAGLLADLRLLHFHIGSQINDIAVLKDALQEAGRIYVELTRLGAPMGYLDVGGGLGIDYDGSRTASAASKNYSLQNYANDVVATVRECCEPHGVTPPTLVSESGRALASHFSVLVFNVLGAASLTGSEPEAAVEEALILRNLRETLHTIEAWPARGSEHDSSQGADASAVSGVLEHLQEAWNDALKFRDDALAAFRLGYLSLPERGKAEQLSWACCRAIARHLATLPPGTAVPEELRTLPAVLAGTYYANLSVFRSAPDTWAIDQLFPVLPLQRLNEQPTRLGSFADLTCDSDGKLARFIDRGQVKPLLELHELRQGEPYWMGLFLAGAYQEVMGNLHNLFGSTNAVHIRLAAGGGYQVDHVVRGDTNAEVLQAMEHDPDLLLERLRVASEVAIASGRLGIGDARRLMAHLRSSLEQTTYLEEG
ncbi:MAG: biosynthetic arginine decarboxylase [Cyanobium sp. Prado107]|jgi:arginine decarboxylase|nr:biosynthetic arginine decarboxylase [Cyanobium sp. Prado107]